ncbi:hypothetical protein [Legionella sp.]|uniref:hypothetical protein n=1 Tax=Legionella sp. TaxID=459 RepID=UPI003C9A9EE9
MSKNIAFTAELDLKFFTQEQFESIDGLSSAGHASTLVRNVLRILMMGWTKSWRELLTSTVFHAVFIKRNFELVREMRCAFQNGFEELFSQLDGCSLNEDQKEQVQLYLSNCLSLLPYSDLTAYESIKVPQLIEEKWQLVEYQVKPIELTKGNEWDQDRVFAYGLEPLFQRKAESHLIFMGTTYPAGQGFLSQINANARGFESVGKILYQTGRKRIHTWLEQQENKIHVCGTSQGGSLSLLLAIDKGTDKSTYQLSRVDALNPAGLHDMLDDWEKLQDKPEVVVQKQGADPVSSFGLWKNDWRILHVIPPAEKQGPNGFWDHALNYAGLKGTQFNSIDAQEDNATRDKRNFWFFFLGRIFIYYTILVPYTYIYRPVGYFFAKNWPLLILMPVSLLIIHFAVRSVLTGLALVVLTSILVMAAISIFLTPIFKSRSIISYAKMHDPHLPRNKHMDIYDIDNAVDIDLNYQQVNTYYQIMRCLVKQKEFLPHKECPSKNIQLLSKRALLEASENPANASICVSFRVTKAKAALFRHSLTLIHKIGVKNQEKLKQALEENYKEYRLGKPLNSPKLSS